MEREFKRYVIYSSGKVYSKKFKRYLKPTVRQNGSLTISLYFEGVTKPIPVHTLIAQVFLDNPQNRKVVMHIDGDKTNNDIVNLEWSTHKERLNHYMDKGLVKRAENSGRPKRRVEAIKLRGSKIISHDSIADAARFHGAFPQNVLRVIQGQRNHTRGYKFRYEKTHENIS